jgi:hypothetical protein
LKAASVAGGDNRLKGGRIRFSLRENRDDGLSFAQALKAASVAGGDNRLKGGRIRFSLRENRDHSLSRRLRPLKPAAQEPKSPPPYSDKDGSCCYIV